MNSAELLNDQEAAMRLMLDGRQSTIWTAIPCIVQAVNWAQMTLDAQPAIQGVVRSFDGTESFVNLPKLINCPITFPSAGGFTITLPIQVGDEVLILIASRCIDAWWQSGGIQVPMEARMHDLSDGFALPGPKSLPNVIPSISSTAAQVRNDAGTSYLELSADGKIKIVSPVEIDVIGNLHVTGAVVASGEVTGNGVALSTHTHSAGSLSSPSGPVTGDTGAPI